MSGKKGGEGAPGCAGCAGVRVSGWARRGGPDSGSGSSSEMLCRSRMHPALHPVCPAPAVTGCPSAPSKPNNRMGTAAPTTQHLPRPRHDLQDPPAPLPLSHVLSFYPCNAPAPPPRLFPPPPHWVRSGLVWFGLVSLTPPSLFATPPVLVNRRHPASTSYIILRTVGMVKKHPPPSIFVWLGARA